MSSTPPPPPPLVDIPDEHDDENDKPLPERIARVRSEWPNPPQARDAAIWFYDIESLHNIFTVTIYDPRSNRLSLFFLCDDPELTSAINPHTARRIIREKNRYITQGKNVVPDANIGLYDLHDDLSHQLLCGLLGIGMLDDVNTLDVRHPEVKTPEQAKALDPLRRQVGHPFVADTHVDYDYTKNVMIAGYNSNEYDMTMMANYFRQMESQAFGDANWFIGHREKYQELERELVERSKKNPASVPADAHDKLVEAFRKEIAEHRETTEWFVPTTAAKLREFNDDLFGADRMSMFLDKDDPRSKIRRTMLNSGRHLDVALLNEKAKYVGLKRLCGMLGFQILESEKLSGPNASVETVEDIYDLLAYNASDTINLHRLFMHPLYSNAFDLKASLIHLYPETVFRNENGGNKGSQRPRIASNNVNPYRLRIDSTSAQIVSKMLAPYAPLSDIPAVSFTYPSMRIIEKEHAAGNHDAKQIDVLDYVREQFTSKVTDTEAIARLDEALDFYRSIRGKNFNGLTDYRGNLVYGEPEYLADVPKTKLNLPYVDAQGQPTGCYVTFSTGGIHGAELNVAYQQARLRAVRLKLDVIEKVKVEFPDATAMRNMCGNQPWNDEDGTQRLDAKGKPMWTKQMPILDDDGEPVLTESGRPAKRSTKYIRLADGTFVLAADVLKPGSTMKQAEYRSTDLPSNVQLFVDKEVLDPDTDTLVTQNTPNKDLTYTSIGSTIHEDFTSYYPSLLTNMSAFHNEALGADRYVAMYDEKNKLGKLKKEADKAGDTVAYETYDLLQKGTKLGLNAASGAADAMTGRQIRMNNTIISMRIIGQLFTWWVAQAQALEGGDVVSTNTDGVYVLMDLNKAAGILDEVKQPIRVEIEPEEVLLVSKDSNNRLELEIKEGVDRTHLDSTTTRIVGASGGTLACHQRPNPGNSLAHAAVLDYVLVHYLSELAFLEHNAQHHVSRCDGVHIDPETGLDQGLDVECDACEESRRVLCHLSIADPFDEKRARRFVDGLLGKPMIASPDALAWSPPKEFSATYALTMFQTMVTASRGAMAYPFSFETLDEDGNVHGHKVLQDFNRVFFVREDAPTAGWSKVHLMKANAAKIPPSAVAKLSDVTRDGLPCHGVKPDDPSNARVAKEILEHKGFYSTQLPQRVRAGLRLNESNLVGNDRELKVARISGIDPEHTVIIVNDDVMSMTEQEAQVILDALDVQVYLDMARATYENNWRNRMWVP